MASQVEEKPKGNEKSKSDWVLPVALIGGVAAVGAGLIFYLHKPGIPPGSNIKALFKFSYSGQGGKYILQVSLGHVRIVFDHIEGMTWSKEVTLNESKEYEIPLEFKLAEAASPGPYDAEALIRLPGSDWLDYVPGGKLVTKSAILISEVK